MAITRTAWIDDDGTGTTGTVINNAEKTLLYDQIDAALVGYLPVNPSGYLTRDLLWSPDATYDIGKSLANRPRDVFCSRNLTAGGLLAVQGAGFHTFSAATAGLNGIDIRNTTAGTGSLASFRIGNNSAPNLLEIFVSSSTFTSAGPYVASGVSLDAQGTGGLAILASQAAGAIRWYSGGTTLRWTMDTAGHLVGETGRNLHLTGVGQIRVDDTEAQTGTQVVHNANGIYYNLTSSARFKEHLAPWAVSPELLTQFVAVSPKLWDYKQQASGAAGFVAEDLEALPIRNAYHRSPLVNYDAEGRPESNRDFALIGLQHLVIQDLWRRVAALEGRL